MSFCFGTFLNLRNFSKMFLKAFLYGGVCTHFLYSWNLSVVVTWPGSSIGSCSSISSIIGVLRPVPRDGQPYLIISTSACTHCHSKGANHLECPLQCKLLLCSCFSGQLLLDCTRAVCNQQNRLEQIRAP